ncbi:MAG: sigma-70 family RNA polymerase sigma factor [Thermoanaerobaculales bacterium]|nr:sigma-70 family RNA polymerase sigma factor [Thermoanaerobaculales bacterium]
MATASAVPAGPPMLRAVSSQAQPDQGRLAARAARGEVGAFEELYRLNVGRIYALCLRMSGNPSLAEEMVQETFVRAWQKVGSFRGASAFSTWLHRVAVNVVLGHQRTTDRRVARVTAPLDDAFPERTVPTAHPGETIDLERAIGGLPEGARTVFILHDVEGFRHHEISGLTGIAVGTSKAQLHRARKLLRKALKP